ncbi:MAG: hypothetical protein KIB43_01220 [Clostridium baratii]|uniref:YtxH domain-containing protein n=1 Tax=Clostridium baratii TaxID=1561 RepID=UPI0006C41199|nr:YtxH domain-containing protein [Clostridium baratii]MBS6005556.1 hypothetical protein [Clostridium baratii]MDU1052622.1 YtxH domain-containing protein [Clostridium baratii]MDU4910118.1 YtxH domain-containing protein [Clostridium baratii]CUP31801.1 Uncharacterised protein [Clostridium baratii]
MGKMIKGMAAGALIGTAVGMVMLPRMDKRTRRHMRRAGKRFINAAGETYDNMMTMMK